jgi:holo-[acyl-carrier protein] synthase
MIVGIGTDLVAIDRIQKLWDEFGDRFVNRIYNETERQKALADVNPAKVLASRFAAKEAAAKAIGHAIRDGILFQDFAISNDTKGRPVLHISGMANTHLLSKIPIGYTPQFDLSLSEDGNMAMAFVVISANLQK